MQPAGNQLILLGQVVGTHGLRGDLKIRSHPENQAALLAAPCLYLRRGEGEVARLTPLQSFVGKGSLIVRFSGSDHKDSVARLVGADVLIDPDELERQDDEVFWFELEGVEVIDRERGSIGHLVEMFRTAAHGIYVVQGEYGEVLIPVVPQFVEGLDAGSGSLLVDVPEGLFLDRP